VHYEESGARRAHTEEPGHLKADHEDNKSLKELNLFNHRGDFVQIS
jgi:hypothetical protein